MESRGESTSRGGGWRAGERVEVEWRVGMGVSLTTMYILM